MSTKKSPRIFSATVLVYEDGTLAITDSDIKGLIIEVETFHELIVELRLVASDLLALNHGLTDEQIAESELRIEFKFTTDADDQKRGLPRASLPKVSWVNKKLSHSPQYA